jgi:DNA repair exonuclease SbcCD nuclease subunit
MYKFAHITDCHLGSWRNHKLRELNIQAFEKAIDACISEKVDFILITGDFFDVNVPQLAPVKRAVDVLKKALDAGILVYMIYGSHDFNIANISMIDILHSASLFIKPVQFVHNNGRINLKFFVDPKTGAKITGISGRVMGLDKEIYELLDRNELETEKGFKIFLMHTGIKEFMPLNMNVPDSIPFSELPKGFGYYGGGHIHKKIERKLSPLSIVIYPGPIFGSTFQDLEETANGEKRGFYIVKFNDKLVSYEFIELPTVEIISKVLSVTNLTSSQIDDKLKQLVNQLDVKNKIVLLKLKGKVNAKIGTINFSRRNSEFINNGAIASFINSTSLSRIESKSITTSGSDIANIEKLVLVDRLKDFNSTRKVKKSICDRFDNSFLGKAGEIKAISLLTTLKLGRLENETNLNYDDRMLAEAKTVIFS